MIILLDSKLQKLAKELVKNEKVVYTADAEKDILKWNYSKDYLIKAFQEGILISGKEIYDKKPEYHNRNYCISCVKKKTLFGLSAKHYNNLAWSFTNNFKELVIFIHTSPCGGYETRLYKLAKKQLKNSSL